MRADKPFSSKCGRTFDWGPTLSEGMFVSSGVPVSTQGPEIVNGYGDGTIFQPQDRRQDADVVEASTSTPTTGSHSWPSRTRASSGGFSTCSTCSTVTADGRRSTTSMRMRESMPGAQQSRRYGNPAYNPSLPHSLFYRTPIHQRLALGSVRHPVHAFTTRVGSSFAPGTTPDLITKMADVLLPRLSRESRTGEQHDAQDLHRGSCFARRLRCRAFCDFSADASDRNNFVSRADDAPASRNR